MIANQHPDGRTHKIDISYPNCFHRRELLLWCLTTVFAGSVGWGGHNFIAAASPFEADRFIDLSSKLCGMPIEDRSLADIIQKALAARYANEEFWRLAELVKSVDPNDVERLNASSAVWELAKSILSAWYSGRIGVGERTLVLAYDEALAWRATNFAKAPGVCGAFGDWVTKPHGALDHESSP